MLCSPFLEPDPPNESGAGWRVEHLPKAKRRSRENDVYFTQRSDTLLKGLPGFGLLKTERFIYLMYIPNIGDIYGTSND